MVKMDIRLYTLYNVISALLWVPPLIYAGYFLGKLIPNLEKYILLIIGLIILLSLLPLAQKLRKS